MLSEATARDHAVWDPRHRHSLRLENGIEFLDELGVPIAQQELGWDRLVGEERRHITGLVRHPYCVRLCG
jgi:hypothetical protein